MLQVAVMGGVDLCCDTLVRRGGISRSRRGGCGGTGTNPDCGRQRGTRQEPVGPKHLGLVKQRYLTARITRPRPRLRYPKIVGMVITGDAFRARAVVLVEGVSDQLALEALARRRGRDLDA